MPHRPSPPTVCQLATRATSGQTDGSVRSGDASLLVVQVRSLGYRTDLMMLRLQGSQIDDHGDHLRIKTPHNPTFWWGNFLLYARPPAAGDLHSWVETFERELPGATHRAFGVDGTDGAAGSRDEIALAGLRLDPSIVLTASELTPVGKAPSDVAVRRLSVDDDHDWSASIALQEAGTEDMEPRAHLIYLTDKMRAYRQLQDGGHGAWFGAFVDGTMRGGLGVFSDGSGVARYQSVETHPEYRRRGLATSMLRAAGRYALDELGARTLVIVADPGYHAIELYRRLGFTDSEQQVGLERRPKD